MMVLKTGGTLEGPGGPGGPGKAFREITYVMSIFFVFPAQDGDGYCKVPVQGEVLFHNWVRAWHGHERWDGALGGLIWEWDNGYLPSYTHLVHLGRCYFAFDWFL